jgi:ATP-binding cassette, subfamily B, bacterial
MATSASSQTVAPAETPDVGDPPPARSLGPLAMIFKAARAYPGLIALAGVALFVTAAATLAIPAYFREVIDGGFTQGTNPEEINRWFRNLFMIAAVLALGTACRFYFVSMLGERVVADIRQRVQENLLRLSPGFFEENSPKEISSRMTADTAQIEVVVGTTVSVALRNLIMAIGGSAYMIVLAPGLALLMAVAIPVVIVPIVLIGRRLRKVSRESQDRVADVGAQVSEVLGAMKIVQGFNQEKRELGRFAEKVEATFNTARQRITLRAVMTAVVIALIFGAITGVMWRGALLVAEGSLSGGDIAAFVLTGMLVAGAFGALAEVYGDLLRGAGAASRLNELLNEKPAIAPPARPVALPEPPRGSLSFQNVTFSYPTRLSENAIESFSLTVEPGETVAIVGPSGAGKSTIFQLAERFYDPTSGTVKMDGVPLTQADPAAIRARMALVPQEGTLFAANARDNLRYGAWNATEEQIWQAARDANAETFLRALPDGLDTYLGEGGARLSGGQRQRVAIARALLRDAPILLLDEATSALDAESEQLVQRALDRLMQDRTTIVIAHRLATVRAADRIIVMDGGRIVEEGDHASLIARGGLYARLAALQFDDAAA